MTVFESRLDRVLAEVGMNRRDMLRRTGGTLASASLNKGEIAQKILRNIASAPVGSAVFKVNEDIFTWLLQYMAIHDYSFEEAVKDMSADVNYSILDANGIPREGWRPDLVTPEMVSAYLKRMVNDGDYKKFGWFITSQPHYLDMFGPTLRELLNEITKKVGGYPQLLRAVGFEGMPLLYRIEVLKRLLPEMRKLIPFDAMDASPEQLKQIEKLVGKRFKTDWTRTNTKMKKKDQRYNEKVAHQDGQPWVRTDLGGGMHQPFEARLTRALSLV